MNRFLSKIRRLARHPSVEVPGMCVAVVLLVGVAVFISGGGMAKINNVLALTSIAPESQTGCVFPCNNTAYQLQALIPMQNGVPVSTVLPGTSVSWIWNAGIYSGNNFQGVCAGRSFGPSHMCTVAQGSPNTNFGTCSAAYTTPAYCPAGQSQMTCGKYGCTTSCRVPLVPAVYHPVSGNCGNADAAYGRTCYGGSGGYPGSSTYGSCPGYEGNTPNTLLLTAPATPGTYNYYFCSNIMLHARTYSSNYSDLPCLGTTLTVATPTTLTSFTATPSVTTGSTATLAWTGTKGSNFNACLLTGGQWGSGTWFTTLPGSIQTTPLTQTTAYTMNCYNTNGSNTGVRSATVTVTGPADVCTDIAGNQASLPSGCTGPTPAPVGTCIPSGQEFNGTICAPVPVCSGDHQLGTPPNCTCELGYQMQGGTCVLLTCSNPNEVNPPTCSCATGYSRDAGTGMCMQDPVLSVTVNGLAATRVRKGTEVTVAWSATGVVAGSCSLTTNAGTTLGSSASGSVLVAVANQTTYRLACQNESGVAVSQEANATLIPEVIEQ